MKINMSRAERGSENGVTIREFGPGVVDVAESLAREFIGMGIAKAVTDDEQPDPHGDEMPEPKPIEMESAAVAHPRQNKPGRRKGS